MYMGHIYTESYSLFIMVEIQHLNSNLTKHHYFIWQPAGPLPYKLPCVARTLSSSIHIYTVV